MQKRRSFCERSSTERNTSEARAIRVDEKGKVGRMVRRPTRQDIPLAAQEQLIVELYSK